MKIRNKLIIGGFCFSCFSLALAQQSQVDIQGVSAEIAENIRSNLSLLQEHEDLVLDASHQSEYQARAEQEILHALQPFGYYSPNVSSQIFLEDGHWHAIFTIQLGPPIIVKDMHLNLTGPGKEDPKLDNIFALFPLRKGDIFSHILYEQGKKDMLSEAIQKGYLNAIYTDHRVNVSLQEHTSDIAITLNTGDRHYFGDVTFSQSKLSEDFLKRYVPFEFGEPYTPMKILALQSHLAQSDYFSSVNVKTLPHENSIAVPVSVELEDAKPNQYVIGAGYGTDTGIRGKLGWTRRAVNSYGHRIDAYVLGSEIYDKLQFDYIVPGKHPHTDEFKFKVALFKDEYNEKSSQIYEGGIVEIRDLHEWQRQTSLFYRHEKYPAYSTFQEVQAKLVIPAVTFIRTKRDDNTAPHSGSRIEISMRGAIDALFSDVNFFQAYLGYRLLHPVSSKTKVLLRGELGFTLPDQVLNLPNSQRFFAGGDLSIRGYGYRSLPNEIDKEGVVAPVGGTYLGVGSIQITQVIKKPVGVFAFFDFGNAFRAHYHDPIVAGTGAGIEWQTRLGPIKFAVAKPLSKNIHAWRIHASFGPEL